MSTTAVRISPTAGRPQNHAVKIAEHASEAWYGAHGSGDLDIPLSVVAALSLIDPRHGERHGIAAELIKSGPDEFADAMRGIWTMFARIRPDLFNPVYPLLVLWVDRDRPMTPENRRAAKRVADAVLRIDLLGLTGTENRHDVDLLGLVLTLLRPRSALQGRGQYYTATSVADALADVTMMGDLTSWDAAPGAKIHDPACGTGGLIRGAAESLRRRGADPADYEWYGNDIDALAIAGFAVNAVLWGLGHNVVLGVADSLCEPDWTRGALRMRQETIAVARDAERTAHFRDAVRHVDRLLNGITSDTAAPPDAH
ncbi:hypothetical protein [Alloactinosynnema sp. L-07]|uniref:N-6 DNA methylase n=1 Tax=Alloactinosynnema sp. L-07 TaxID=1653480 RepID=UPI00065F030C|nr:N-6 DNA methylase [Alloactinosynnema sp. L-07]CRK56921.1 hypothetical protein [Alloactinosynnema sp. L-07]